MLNRSRQAFCHAQHHAEHQPPRLAVSYSTGFWTVALAFMVVMAIGALPTPLYVLYERRDHLTGFVVTVIFAAYAGGVIASLFLAGHVSDWFGRRRVLIPAIVLQAGAAAVFALWPSLPGLLVARVVSGLAVGATTATATAYLAELHDAGPDGPRAGAPSWWRSPPISEGSAWARSAPGCSPSSFPIRSCCPT